MQSPNDLIHQPVRLKIMAALNTLGSRQWLDFVSLRSIVDTTDGCRQETANAGLPDGGWA